MSATGPAASEVKKLREAIETTYRGNMSANSGDGDRRSWLSGNLGAILQALVIAGILGLFSSISDLKESTAELKATINERGKQNERDIERIDGTLGRHDQRITDLERGQSASQFDADRRQKR